MPPATRPERLTQNRAVKRVTESLAPGGLGYANLGHWRKRERNRCIETAYVVVHEMLHLLESTHSDQFVLLLDRHWPQWRESRGELNALPLAPEIWTE